MRYEDETGAGHWVPCSFQPVTHLWVVMRDLQCLNVWWAPFTCFYTLIHSWWTSPSEWFKESESESEVAQSCPTLCDLMGCSLPGSSLHGILQARVLEWVAISFSRGSSRPRDQTRVSRILSIHFNLSATKAFMDWSIFKTSNAVYACVCMATPLRLRAAADAFRLWFPGVAPPGWVGSLKPYLVLSRGWIS